MVFLDFRYGFKNETMPDIFTQLNKFNLSFVTASTGEDADQTKLFNYFFKRFKSSYYETIN